MPGTTSASPQPVQFSDADSQIAGPVPRKRLAVSDRIDRPPAALQGSSGVGQAMDRPRGSVGYGSAGTAEIKRRVGRYEVGEVIGRGGAAVVYLAHQRDLHRQVALKELAPFYAVDREFAERFVEESRMIATLNHPNVVTVHEYFEDAGAPYIAMEYLARGSLRPFIGRLGIAEIVGVLDSVLAGLAHGESRGIVHRDLKPENLLVADDGRVKIADFGVARAINNATPRRVVTASGATIGTPAYMAPEVALGATLSPVMDLYSLGIVVWELLTGRVPFEDTGSPAAVLYRQAYEPVPPVEAVVPGIDERLAEWLRRMLRKRPEDRFESAQDAWDRLEDIVIELLGPRWRRLAPLAPVPTEVGRIRSAPAAHVAEPSLPFATAASAGGGLRGGRRRGRGRWRLRRSGERSSVPGDLAVEPVASPASCMAPTTIQRPGRRHWSSETASGAGANSAVSAPEIRAPVTRRGKSRPGWPLARGGRDHSTRKGWIPLVAGLLLATGLAALLVRELPRSTTPPATVAVTKQDVSRLNATVQLFILGKRLSHVEHKYRAAAANRRLVLDRLMALHAPRPLRAAAQTLTQMTADSLSFNVHMARGEIAVGRAPDAAHNALRSRFVDEFNPYARRYLAQTYEATDL